MDILPLVFIQPLYTEVPVAVHDGCGSVAFVYWLRLKHGCANHDTEGKRFKSPSTAVT